MSITVVVSSIVRASVPISTNGVVMLDRGSSAAGAVSAEFLDAISDAGFGGLRDRTTGHNNIPRSHPTDSQFHSYKFGDFTTIGTAFNLWDTARARSDGGAKAEIITLAAVATMEATLRARMPGLIWHEFVDWQSGYSEGLESSPGSGDVFWMRNRDPNLVDLAGNPLTSGMPAYDAMTSVEFKYLENKQHLKTVIDGGVPAASIIVNVGGEDWRGWPSPKTDFVPWNLFIDQDDEDQDRKSQWIADRQAEFMINLKTYINDVLGHTGVRYSFGFLESKEGGDFPPLSDATIRRDNKHLRMSIRACGSVASFACSSCHYRGNWERFLVEDQLVLAFCTPNGHATFSEARAYIQAAAAEEGFPGIDFIPMANGVGDVEDEKGDTNTPLTPFQKGLVVTQYLKDIIEAGIEAAYNFPGISYDHNAAGFTPEEGVMGKSTTTNLFTKFPMYYPMQVIGQILKKGADLIQTDVTIAQCPTMSFQWTESGKTILGIVILNKVAQRTVPLFISGEWGAANCRLAKRYTESDTTFPEISPPITTIGADFFVTLAEESITYLELEEADLSQLSQIPFYQLRAVVDHPARDLGREYITPKQLVGSAIGRQLLTAVIDVGDETANVRIIDVILYNEEGRRIDYAETFSLVVFADASMTTLSNGGSTGIAATTGIAQAVVAKKIFFCTTDITGHWAGTWTDTGTDPAMIGIQLPGGAWALSGEFANT